MRREGESLYIRLEGLTRVIATRSTVCKLFSASCRWIGINTSFWLLCQSTSDDAGLEEGEGEGEGPLSFAPFFCSDVLANESI